jgi:rfaE bifunctional protein kinase chain/domain
MQKKEIIQLFEAFNQLNVLIIGDVMVDSYLWGQVDRISPEAPVPIVSVKSRENRLGGAANVALNIKALGANPILCSVIGSDQKGREFVGLLEAEKMETAGILTSNDRITTTKFRVIGNKMQMLRVDEETDKLLSVSDRNDFYQSFLQIIEKKKINVIIFQDYDKGVISNELIIDVVRIAKEKGIPVAVDPKKRNFRAYQNVTLFKPNLKELKEGLHIDIDPKDEIQLKEAVTQLNKTLQAEMILLTLSEDGVFVEYKQNGQKYSRILPSHVRSISDVSGAGDTVISVASLCLALHVEPGILASISNLAGGMVCEKPGVVPVDKNQLMQETMMLNISL